MATETTTPEKSKTSAQVLVDYYDSSIPRRRALTPVQAREIASDPTIKMAIRCACGPIVASQWGVEGDDAEIEYIEDQLIPLRESFLTVALYNLTVFGSAFFELIFNVDGTLDKLKPLKFDCTRARRDKSDGSFLGLVTDDLYTGQAVYIDAEHSLFLSLDTEAEGLGGYGKADIDALQATFDQITENNDAWSRHQRKLAGGVWKVDYRPGTTPIDGEETDNADIASDFGAALKSSGTIITPNEPVLMGEDAVKTFEIEHVAPDAGAGTGYLDRAKRLDALIARALGIPEAAINEAHLTGSRAQSESAISIALLNMQLRHQWITCLLNKHIVGRLLLIKFGAEDGARLVAMPLDDEKLAVYKDTLDKFLANTELTPDVYDRVDMDVLIDAVGLPPREETTPQVLNPPEPEPAPVMVAPQGPPAQ